jgi:hypothetical protein
MNNYQPIPFEQSKYIILSSSFFLVPAYMFYYHHHYLIGNFATLTSIVSINYWYNVEYDSWRRYSDLVWSKISFCIFFTLGVCYIPPGEQVLCIFITIAFLTCYYVANSLSQKDIRQYEWVWCHMVFHLLLSLNLCIIARNMSSIP